MGKLLGVLAAAALLLVGPLALAAVVMAAQIPAAAQEHSAADCSSGPIPATGTWRPPYQQAYARTSAFGSRFDPVYLRQQLHAGQDLAALPTSGPVVAAAAGKVVQAGSNGGYGLSVTVAHAEGISTLYAHLARIEAGITTGAVVRVGQVLGIEGATGASQGNHLHFEVRRNGTPIDPVPFMAERGAPLNGKAVAPSTPTPTGQASLPPASGGGGEGGVGFPLPPPGQPRKDSLTNPALPIPPRIQALYVAAAAAYRLPWALLAGVGMDETGHGANKAPSAAGALGLMQFMPDTFARYGVDGDGDGRAEITNDADSIYSAANYLTASGVSRGGAEGVRDALYAYNQAHWYVNDVLYYAGVYGGGTIWGDPSGCGQEPTTHDTSRPTGGAEQGQRVLTALSSPRVATLLAWGQTHLGDPYQVGANGPHAWDCSSFVQAAFAQIQISLPRTAQAQRDWLAAGNGTPVPYGQERPGDLVFTDSYLGPHHIGHVQLVADPATGQSLEAGGTRVGHYRYARTGQAIYEIWRVANLRDHPATG